MQGLFGRLCWGKVRLPLLNDKVLTDIDSRQVRMTHKFPLSLTTLQVF